MPGWIGVDRGAECLDAADARGASAWFDNELVVAADRPVGERSRHDGAASLGGEHAVDPEPCSAAVEGRRRACDEVVERAPQLVEPSPDGAATATIGAPARNVPAT